MAKPKRPRRHNEAPRSADNTLPGIREYNEKRTRRWVWDPEEDFKEVTEVVKEEGEGE